MASLVWLFAAASALAGQAPSRTILDGVYSEPQAERGRNVYTTVCRSCHGPALEGIAAPPLTGTRFIERWREGTLDSLYTFIRERMPFGVPAGGKRTDSEYLDILTYILKVNGYRSGETDLFTSVLDKVTVVGMKGPQPVPDGSLVIVVGCLAQTDETRWSLSNATEPVRTRTEGVSNPEELKDAAQKQLGMLTFRLADLDAVPGFMPGAHKGHKMLAKGFLVRQPNAERINLTWMEMLTSSTCPLP